jgi:hypothetical protein
MTPKPTHAVMLLDARFTQYQQGHIVKSSVAHCLEHAHNYACALMNENDNMNHYVVLAEIIETHYYESTLKVSKP